MPSPLADITRFLGGYRQGQLEAEDRDYLRQKRAMEEEDRAAIMRETGYSPSVLKAQQIKMQMDRLREEAETRRIANISGKAGRLVAMGDTAGANQTLRSGGLDAVQIDDDPEDPEYVHFTTKVGKYRVPRLAGAMIANDPMKYAKDEYALERMLAGVQARSQSKIAEQEHRQAFTSEENRKKQQNQWEMLKYRLAHQAGRGGAGGSGGATMVQLSTRADMLMATNPGMSHADAWNQAWSEKVMGAGKYASEKKPYVDALKTELKMRMDNFDTEGANAVMAKMLAFTKPPTKTKATAAHEQPKRDNLPPRPWEKRK